MQFIESASFYDSLCNGIGGSIYNGMDYYLIMTANNDSKWNSVPVNIMGFSSFIALQNENSLYSSIVEIKMLRCHA